MDGGQAPHEEAGTTGVEVRGNASQRWVERLALTDFRNYRSVTLSTASTPIVLIGSNGAGKTNLLEAVSLLAPGQGLRRAAFGDLSLNGGSGGWAVAARLHTPLGAIEIGTGLSAAGADRTGRIVRIDRQTVSGSGALADHVDMVWLLPAMDGLFTGPASDRRRFLDRLILCFDAPYRTLLGQYERAMRQRNRLLEGSAPPPAHLDGLEMLLAETGVAIAAARLAMVDNLARMIEARRNADPHSPFPWAQLAIEGALEVDVAGHPAVEVEDRFRAQLRAGRDRDRAAGRMLEGPHRGDLAVIHGPKAMPARLCSTGEQKALLIGLVLAHAALVAEAKGGAAPILLLDEVAAHLDEIRRTALFDEVLRLGTQAWMTGTDETAFERLRNTAQFMHVEDGAIGPL